MKEQIFYVLNDDFLIKEFYMTYKVESFFSKKINDD